MLLIFHNTKSNHETGAHHTNSISVIHKLLYVKKNPPKTYYETFLDVIEAVFLSKFNDIVTIKIGCYACLFL
jgi:hypothetical protein